MHKILFIDHTAQLSGGELSMLSLIRQLDRSRFDPQVLLFSTGPLADALRQENITVHQLELDPAINQATRHAAGRAAALHPKRVLATFTFLRRLAKTIRQIQPDIVHTNSLKADLLGGIAARRAGTKVIWHVRDRIAPDYLAPHMVRLMRFMARRIPHAVIANSHATLATVHLRPGSRSAVIYSGLPDPQAQPPPEHIAKPAGQTVIMVGRLSPWKGQDVFIRAAAAVHRHLPHVQFQIVGSALFGEDAYEAQLLQLVQSLHLQDVISFLGFRRDIPQLVAAADVLVHASTTPEPFGQVVVQAMAAGRPAIATNAGGIQEIVLDQRTGLLVPMADADAMASAMIQLLSHPEQAAAMGRAGRRRFLEMFTIQRTAAQVTALYDSMLTGADRQLGLATESTEAESKTGY